MENRSRTDRASESRRERATSFAQERLWLLAQLEPASTAYHVSAIVRLRGDLDVERLRRACHEIVRRHDVLRTTYVFSGGELRSRVAGRWQLAVPLADLRALPPPAAARAARALTGGALARPFDLGAGPLVRALLLRTRDAEHRLVLSFHHVAFDGASLFVFARELDALYRGAALPEPPLRYADYAAWQRAEAARRGAADSEYWRRKLGGAPAPLELPADRRRPAVRSFRGASHRAALPAALAERLEQMSREHGVTLFMTLLAALDVLLWRHSGCDDVLVGAPISVRTHPGTRELIGCFVDTVVLRVDVSGRPSFRELLDRVRHTAFEAYQHLALPFEKILEIVRPSRDPSRTPLFQVFLNLLPPPAGPLALGGLEASLETLPEAAAKFDVTIYARRAENGLTLTWVYDAELFDAARIADMAAQYAGLLRQAAADPERGIDRPSLVTAAARRILPDPRRPLDAAWRGAVHEVFAARARARPAAPAIVESGHTWSYRQLDAASGRLARELGRAGIVAGARQVVSIHAHRRASLVAAILAVMKAGGVFHVHDPATPASRSLRLLGKLRPWAWLELAGAPPPAGELRDFLDGLPLVVRRRLPADLDAIAPASSGAAPRPAVSAADVAYAAFTSGSAGEPMAVLGRHGPLSHVVPWYCAAYGLDAADRFSMLSGLAHDPLHRDVLIPLQIGAAVCVPDPGDFDLPGRLAAWMRRRGVTVAHLTPAMAELLARPAPGGAPPSLPELRCAVFLGDVLKRATVEAVRALAPAAALCNSYGTTETGRAVSSYAIPAGGRGPEIVPLGRGIGGVQLLVLNARGELAGIGELGEIHVRSPHLAAGYLDDEASTARTFTGRGDDRLYATGDRGRFLPDGGVAFAGRADRQVQVRGFRVEPREVEVELERHPGVRQAVVAGRDDPRARRRLVAWVVAADADLDAAALDAYLRQRLPAEMVPARLLLLAALPLTANGKVDAAALPAPDWQGERRPRRGPPRTSTERRLRDVWIRVLGIRDAGIHDCFFALGGDSLLAMQMVAEARQAGVELRLRQVFEQPTIAGLARVAGRGVAIRAEQGRITGGAPLVAGQRWFFARLSARLAPSPHAFATAIWLGVGHPLAPARLEAHLAALWDHHDALRLRFAPTAEGWRQVHGDDPAPRLARIDLAALPEGARAAALMALPRQLRALLHVVRGPLAGYAWIDCGPRERPRLLLLLHHLVGDVPSWSILREDLETLCSGAGGLGAKTTSFRQWARRLEAYGRSPALRGERAYWEAMPESGDCRWPAPPAAAPGFGRARVSLTAQPTERLLRALAGALPILLTALARAVTEKLGGSSLLVRLIGHGRAPLFDDVDLSRTVGWLTTSVPVMLRVRPGEPLGDSLETVRERLERIPSHGIGYGLLRFQHAPPGLAGKLGRLASNALVAFNYYGRAAGGRAAGGRAAGGRAAGGRAPILVPLSQPSPGLYHVAGRSTTLRIMGGVAADGCLRLDWAYDTASLHAPFVDELAASFRRLVNALLDLG